MVKLGFSIGGSLGDVYSIMTLPSNRRVRKVRSILGHLRFGEMVGIIGWPREAHMSTTARPSMPSALMTFQEILKISMSPQFKFYVISYREM